MKKSLLWWVIDCAGVVILVGLIRWQFEPQKKTVAEQKTVVDDEQLQQGVIKSTDLVRDRERMWRTVPSNNPNSKFHVSPVSAINAASRVFATVQLEGKTAVEVATILGAKPRPGYGYDFSLYPPQKDAKEKMLIYRFDCGRFGWQFNVIFDEHGKVSQVQRHGIE